MTSQSRAQPWALDSAMDEMSDSIIEANNLEVRFPAFGFPAFSGISFTVPRGAMFGIFGETGCGKSTLAQCLIGFIPPAIIQGKLLLHLREDLHVDIHKVEEGFWRDKLRGKRVVYIPQDPYKSLNPYQKIGCQLKRVLHAYGAHLSLGELLERVGLSLDISHCFPRTMSAGQRQRVMIAYALAIEPELLILDEPTASTDPSGREMLRKCFQNLTQKGITVVLISHEVDEYLPMIPKTNRLYFSKVTSTSIQIQQKHRRLERKPEPEVPPLLKLSGIKKSFGGLPVLLDLNLTVPPGEWIYLEGSNGTGKTTLLQIISGSLSPDSGSFEWMQKSVRWSRVFSHTRNYIHPVFQDTFHSLNPRLTIRDSLEEVTCCATKKHREEIAQYSEYIFRHLNLPDALYQMFPHQLSYGQQKRVAFLRALLKYRVAKTRDKGSHLFLLDEVFAGIHWTLRDKIIFLLQEMRKEENFSIIWVAHGHEVLKNLCDRVYRLVNGRLEHED